MPPAERSELLKRWAREAGFDRAGVATLEPMARGEALLAWLERGDHAGMAWLERNTELRREPARLLPGARSVVCVALAYAPQEGAEPSGDLWPRVARYARGEDYHELFWRRLEALAERVRLAFPGTATRATADTAPVLERELAERAGLGWVGRHTLLLGRDVGSYFLLGELFTTLDLAPDPPAADLCGRCRRCLDACPTGALPEPYRLDSRRCISYWTIEHRGEVPAAMRTQLGDWVFGCDLCQEACPYNRKSNLRAGDAAFALDEKRAALDLVGLLGLERERYAELFRGSALKRAKLGGLKRNAALAMGNRGEVRYVPALARALEADEDPVVRGHAAWALGRIGGEAALAALEGAVRIEVDAGARREMERAIKAAKLGGLAEVAG
jgi:epoxyqueuosine reductase